MNTTGFSDFQSSVPTAVTIGKFDGLHRGHQMLIGHVVSAAKEGLRPVVLMIRDPQESTSLFTEEERHRLLESFGAEELVVYSLTPEQKSMEPCAFLRHLADCFRMKKVVCGTDFRFGCGGSGDTALLQTQGSALGYSALILPKLRDERDGDVISSTRIRGDLAEGDLVSVSALLGFRWFLSGEIVNGRHQGRTWQIPTINLTPPPQKLLPPRGVYASDARIGGQRWKAVTNIGVSPTVTDGSRLTVETHLLEPAGNLYGQEARIELKRFLRAERKFDSVSALKAQQEKDIAEARRM